MKNLMIIAISLAFVLTTVQAKTCVLIITNQDKAPAYLGLGEVSCDGSKKEEIKYHNRGYQPFNVAYEKTQAESYLINTISEKENVIPYSVIHSENITTIYLKSK